MILDKTSVVRITTSTQEYYKNLGYSFEKLGRKNQKDVKIEVKVEHLPKFTHGKVKCKCSVCDKIYIVRLMRNTNICLTCQRRKQMLGNKLGALLVGVKHGNYNPVAPAIKRYAYNVRSYTRKYFSEELKSLIGDKKIGRMGVDGAFQVDHIIPIKVGYEQNMSIEVIGHLNNLRIIPWKENLDKGIRIIHK